MLRILVVEHGKDLCGTPWQFLNNNRRVVIEIGDTCCGILHEARRGTTFTVKIREIMHETA